MFLSGRVGQILRPTQMGGRWMKFSFVRLCTTPTQLWTVVYSILFFAASGDAANLLWLYCLSTGTLKQNVSPKCGRYGWVHYKYSIMYIPWPFCPSKIQPFYVTTLHTRIYSTTHSSCALQYQVLFLNPFSVDDLLLFPSLSAVFSPSSSRFPLLRGAVLWSYDCCCYRAACCRCYP